MVSHLNVVSTKLANSIFEEGLEEGLCQGDQQQSPWSWIWFGSAMYLQNFMAQILWTE